MKWLLTFILILVAGCSTTQRPPSALEQHFFNVETNTVPIVIVQTNIVWLTNDAGAVLATNTTILRTNQAETYAFTPNERADAVTQIGRAVGSPFGVGELVGMGLAALFGLYGTLRSRKANKTAAVLAQIIETGRAVLQSTPQGQQLDERWVQWMQRHQAEAGVMQEVIALLAKVVDTDSAKGVATDLVGIMDAKK